MSVKRILKYEHIISCVPCSVKADAVYKTLCSELSNMVPATILKTHPNFTLYIDKDSGENRLCNEDK